MKILKVFGIIVVMVMVLSAFNALVVAPQIAEVQSEGRGLVFPSEFQDLRVTGDAEFDKTLDVDGAATLNGGLSVDSTAFAVANTSGNTQIAGTLGVTGTASLVGVVTFGGSSIYSSESITPTDGGTFTPTATIVTLTPAGALGTAVGGCTSNKLSLWYNSVNANVVITDTGNFVGAGNATLGQYDSLFVMCIDSKWVQVSAVSAN